MYCFRIVILCVFVQFSIVSCHKTKPHIIVILADDLGWNDVSFHGADQIPTPNIDALGYNGIILNGHYSQALCTPSRAAFLTGKYPIHLGMQHLVLLEPEPRGLPLNEKLMPEYLKDAGYVTHAIGKWHLGFYRHEYMPLYRGFDTHFGYMNGVQDYYTHEVYATNNDSMHGLDMRRGMNVDYSSIGKYSTTIFTEEAVKLIQNHDNDSPMFMYLSHLAVHSGNRFDRLQAPDEEIAKFTHIPDPERRIYAAMVSLLDKSVGEVVTALRQKGMLENSIILFLSDNGGQTWGIHQNEASNYPLRGMKASPWEGGHRVPAAIWSPLIKNPQRVSEQLIHISDWLPTLFSAAGIPTNVFENIDGINMWEEISRGDKSPRTEMVYNIDDIFNYSAIRRGDWKYVLGTIDSGRQDGWYGDTGLGPQYSYDPEAVLKSDVGVTLTGYLTKQQIAEKQKMGTLNFTNKILTVDKIWEMRNQSTIICNRSVDETANHKCDALVSPCLFNIKDDPCEYVNMASERPIIVQNLENAIAQIRKTIIPPANIPPDSDADPRYWNNTWTSWKDCDYIEQRKRSSMTVTTSAIIGVLCTLFFIIILILIAVSVKSSTYKKNCNADLYALNADIVNYASPEGEKFDRKNSLQIYELAKRNGNEPKNII